MKLSEKIITSLAIIAIAVLVTYFGDNFMIIPMSYSTTGLEAILLDNAFPVAGSLLIIIVAIALFRNNKN